MKQEPRDGIYYMEVQKKSRGPRRSGEVFAIKLKDLGYLFGLVVTDRCALAPSPTSPPQGPWNHKPGFYLLYIFRDLHQDIKHVPDLNPEDLMFPPLITTNMAWNSGHFAKVEQRSMSGQRMLATHCFYRDLLDHSGKVKRTYVNEMGLQLKSGTEPCREAGTIWGTRLIEIDICTALKLPVNGKA